MDRLEEIERRVENAGTRTAIFQAYTSRFREDIDYLLSRLKAAETVVEAVKQYKAEPNLKTSEGVERALHEWRKEYERKS